VICTFVGIVLMISSCGGSGSSSHTAASRPLTTGPTPTSPLPSSAINSQLSDRKFNASDLTAVLRGLPQLSSMSEVDHSDRSSLGLPTSCSDRTKASASVDSWIEYQASDPAGANTTVQISVAQLDGPDKLTAFFADYSSYVSKCNADPLFDPSTAGTVTPLGTSIPQGAGHLVANQFSGGGTIHQEVVIGSGRVLLIVFVKKYDNAQNKAATPDPAGTNQVVKELFANYTQAHASAPVPI
jgi:hypothetical protein